MPGKASYSTVTLKHARIHIVEVLLIAGFAQLDGPSATVLLSTLVIIIKRSMSSALFH
jgi:hypothetical protein